MKCLRHSRDFLLPCLSLVFCALTIKGANAQTDATYPYFRFTPTLLNGSTLIQLSEFQFINDGAPISTAGVIVTNPGGDNPAAEGVTNLLDSNTATKWLDRNMQPLVFQFPAAVTIDTYNYATANDGPDRDPVSWIFEGSTDGASWIPIDAIADFTPIADRFTYISPPFALPETVHPIIVRFNSDPSIVPNGTSLNLTWSSQLGVSAKILPMVGAVNLSDTISNTPPDDSDTSYTLTVNNGSANVSAGRTVRAVTQGSHSQRYIRFTPMKLRADASNSIQLSEFTFSNAGGQIFPVAVTNTGGDSPGAEDSSKLIDGLVTTKWLDFNKQPLIFDFGATVDIDAYSIFTANDFGGRDPVRWILEGSDDLLTWSLVDNVTAFDFSIPEARQVAFQSIPIPLSSSPENLPTGNFPILGEFRADPTIMLNGGSSLLSWSVYFTNNVDMFPAPGANAGLSGTFSASPLANSDIPYTLSALSDGAPFERKLTLRTVSQGSASFRFFRFTPSKPRGFGLANGIQLSEFSFFNSGSPVAPVSASNPLGNNPVGEEPANLIDNNTATKWYDRNESPLIFDFGAATTIDAYNFTTGADAPARDPLRWIMEGSDDQSQWTLVDNVTGFDMGVPATRTQLAQSIRIPVPLSPAPSLFYDFESGLQGWTNVGTSARATGPTEFTTGNPLDAATPEPMSGSAFVFPTEFGAAGGTSIRDQAHDSLILRSPAFTLSPGNITAYLIAGQRGNAAAPTSVANIPAASDAAQGQWIGIAFRRVADDAYLLTKNRLTNSDTWEEITFSAAELALITVPGEEYTLDYIDYADGAWGWSGLDNVSIPGTAIPSSSTLRLISSSYNASTNKLSITFASSPSSTYIVTSSADLQAFNTVEIPGFSGSPGDQTTIEVDVIPGQNRFFRIEEPVL